MSISFDDIDIEASIDSWITTFFSKISLHLNMSESFPQALDDEGKDILSITKFWICYIRIKVADAELNNKRKLFLHLIEKACQIKHDNPIILYDYFVLMIKLFFNPIKIQQYINKKKGSNSNDITKEDYIYLLKHGDFFKKHIKTITMKNSTKVSLEEKYKKKEAENTVYTDYVNSNLKEYDNEKCNRFTLLGRKEPRNTIDCSVEEVWLLSMGKVDRNQKKK